MKQEIFSSSSTAQKQDSDSFMNIDPLSYSQINQKKRYESASPNAVVVYRILLTIPVSVASDERTLSKLKLI